MPHSEKMKYCIVIFSLLCNVIQLSAQQDSIADPLQSYILSLHNKVTTENKIVGEMDPDSSANLPFGIVKEVGATRYIICIDSAEYRNNSASMSAYMAMEFPGSQQMLCFSAQNIAFNPRGVMPGPNTKLVLISEHRMRYTHTYLHYTHTYLH